MTRARLACVRVGEQFGGMLSETLMGEILPYAREILPPCGCEVVDVFPLFEDSESAANL